MKVRFQRALRRIGTFLRDHKEPIKKYLPLVVSVALLIVLAILVPWGEVLRELSHLSFPIIGVLLIWSIIFYAVKTVRYWYMLHPINIHQPLGLVSLAYLSAQPVTLLPAGELYRNAQLERYTGVPMSESAPTFLMQGLLEGIVLVTIAVIGVFGAIQSKIPVLVTAAFIIAVTALLQSDFLQRSKRVVRWLNKIPFVSLSREQLRYFSKQSQRLLKPKTFAALLALSVVAEVAGTAIVYISVRGLGDHHLSLIQAGIVYAVPIVVSFLTFLPGGLGAAEQSTVGLLLLFDVSAGVAVAATLLIRLFLTGMGLVYGWIAGGVLYAAQDRLATKHSNSH